MEKNVEFGIPVVSGSIGTGGGGRSCDIFFVDSSIIFDGFFLLFAILSFEFFFLLFKNDNLP